MEEVLFWIRQFKKCLKLKKKIYLEIIINSQEAAKKYTGKPHAFFLISPNVNILCNYSKILKPRNWH